MTSRTEDKALAAAADYPILRQIDGSHPFKHAVPGGYVDYPARRRNDGEVMYFNFALAREMGLIPDDHPDHLGGELQAALLDTFCLVIINEHDRLNPAMIKRDDILPGSYMATRYLQLQHPGNQGYTSGDGRSIWNGRVTHRGITWDISSCGTGVTCLCPATGQEGKFFETGSAAADYGCGTATQEEGIGAALTSEIFHSNGIDTERVLAVIATPQGQAINVRAGRNLLRPAHLFLYSRQADFRALEAVVDLFVERQVANGDWPKEFATKPGTKAERSARYGYLAEQVARTFARISATFESEYIFCWMDWDGDNILADGGIIDYGSIRQFGLYHRSYRFDDHPRWSTTIPEQRRKARYIVRCFAQIRDFLVTGVRPRLSSLRRDRVLKIFDCEFERVRKRLLLHNIGFSEDLQEYLIANQTGHLEAFQRAHAYFERAQSRRALHRTADGLNRDAIFSTRDLLRELPVHFAHNPEPLSPERFIEICSTRYASQRDRKLNPYRKRLTENFQYHYLELVAAAANARRRTPEALLADLARRSQVINRCDRVTGDAMTYASEELVRNRRRFSASTFYRIIRHYVELQSQDPEKAQKPSKRGSRLRSPDAKAVLDALIEYQDELRHGL